MVSCLSFVGNWRHWPWLEFRRGTPIPHSVLTAIKQRAHPPIAIDQINKVVILWVMNKCKHIYLGKVCRRWGCNISLATSIWCRKHLNWVPSWAHLLFGWLMHLVWSSKSFELTHVWGTCFPSGSMNEMVYSTSKLIPTRKKKRRGCWNISRRREGQVMMNFLNARRTWQDPS